MLNSEILVTISQYLFTVICYRSDGMGKRSEDGKVVVYDRWSSMMVVYNITM